MPIKITGATSGSVTLSAPSTGDDIDVILPDTEVPLTTMDKVPRKNYIINGNFLVAQRNNSSTENGYKVEDRWYNWSHTGGQPITVSHNIFALTNTDIPGQKTYSSTVVGYDGTPTTTNYASKETKIKDVRTLAGDTASLSFWAKSTTSGKSIYVELEQYFGTSGSPSSNVYGIGGTRFDLTTDWTKYTIENISIPSIETKTLGTDINDYLRLLFWLSSGSSWDSRNDSLGYQEFTFRISRVQLERGPVVTEFDVRTFEEELILCQAYYQHSFNYGTYPSVASSIYAGSCRGRNETAVARTAIFGSTRSLITPMKAVPTITLYSISGASGKILCSSPAQDITASILNTGENSIGSYLSLSTAVNSVGTIDYHWTAESEL